MKQALSELKEKICSLHKPEPLIDSRWQEFSDKAIVALMSGGEGSRFQSVTNGSTNKNSFELPNGDTMIEMAIRMYREAGIKNFVALVYHQADTIVEKLGDGSRMGVNIKYSYDPKKPAGKGGAVLNALQNGSIPRDKYLIVHNPDDVIVEDQKNFPKKIAAGHLENESQGGLATVVVVEETPYAYTGMKVVDNKVEQIEMYPMIPMPTHIGVTVFSRGVYPYFEKLFDLGKKSDFEKVLFPVLAEEDRLGAVSIPNESWLAVNNAKAYKQLLGRLNLNK